MLKLTLTQAGKTRLEVLAEKDGVAIDREQFNPGSAKSRNTIAAKLGVEPTTFLRYCQNPGVYEYDDAPPAGPTLAVALRGMYDRQATAVWFNGEPLAAVKQALEAAKTSDLREPVIEWAPAAIAAVLDIDYHRLLTGERPGSARLQYLMSRVQPQPALWWVSRGQGVHGVYTSRGGVPANVLAAVAGFSFLSLDPTIDIEVLTNTRTPPGEVFEPIPTDDLSAVRRFLNGGAEGGDVAEWLNEHGMERGVAYEHSLCPVTPWAESHGKPVFAGETCVVCKACEAKGICFGSRRAGVFPYAALCGGHDFTEISAMVKNFTHWAHAQVVLDARCRLRGPLARLAYEGLLRLTHGNDARVDGVFTAGEHLIRGVGRWVTPDRYETLTDIRPTLATLPAITTATGAKIIERLDLFDQSIDLSRYGYPSIHPLYGLRIFGEYLGRDGGPISIVLPPANLAEPNQSSLRPRYVPENRRLDLDEAFRRVEAVCPNVNRNYLLLLVAARGVSEAETGMPPMIAVAGPTAVGKTATVQLAAAITGDGCGEIQWNAQPERFRQAYMEAMNEGSFVVVDEVFKYAAAARRSARSALDLFLTLTPRSMSHVLYHGPLKLGRLPVTIITDSHIPEEVVADQQLGRRFVYVRMDERIEWEPTLLSSGVGKPDRFRLSSIENAEAGNAIVSHVIDRWFREKALSFAEIAADLGFSRLENCDEVTDNIDALGNLFKAVCAAPESGNTRLKGRGWVVVGMEDDTDVASAWNAVCDGTYSPSTFSKSRKVHETDWSLIAPVPIGTRVDVSKINRSVAIRFRYGEYRGRGDYKVNGELLTCEGRRRV